MRLIKQILKFGAVGGLAFVIDYALLYILTEFLGVHYLASSAISFSVSVIFNYIMSIKWVFDVDRQRGVREFAIFAALSIVGLLLNLAIMYVMADMAKIYYMVSKLFSTAVVMVYNFVTRKLFVEGKHKAISSR